MHPGFFRRVFTQKIVVDPTKTQKIGNKKTMLRNDYCWGFGLFADPTDTWQPAIGVFFNFFFFFNSEKKNIFKKSIKGFMG